MPGISLLLLRTSLVHFTAGLVVGSVLLWEKGNYAAGPVWILRDSHITMLLVGFFIQFVVGTGWWIFPRIAKQRGDDRVMVAGWVLLNAGVALEAVRSLAPILSEDPALVPGILPVICQAAGIICFASQLGPRIVRRFSTHP